MKRSPMTLRGAEMLRAELKQLKSTDRPRVIKAIADARAHGDLSENAEYHAAREQQGFIEGRINEIETRLATAEIIDVAQLPPSDRVVFGASVDLEDQDDGNVVSYQIVGRGRSRHAWPHAQLPDQCGALHLNGRLQAGAALGVRQHQARDRHGGAVQDRHVADARHEHAGTALHQLRQPRFALGAIGGAHPYLDQFVDAQCLQRLRHDIVRQAFLPEQDHGLEAVRFAAQVAELFLAERHARDYPRKRPGAALAA